MEIKNPKSISQINLERDLQGISPELVAAYEAIALLSAEVDSLKAEIATLKGGGA
ncbi:hypothetical protein [Brevibacillus massiliensis]|uniref:hypothetical protein n=1 Tax=Brevibacillus massiliensis TaxID=1118054 RepID=UPI0002DE53A6|nr:hypothetical protein [Brevibacillus massiliensis]